METAAVATPRHARSGRRRSVSALPPGLKIWGWVRSTILTLAAVVGLLSIVVFGGSFVLGLTPLVVVSGSMAPTLPVGSLIFSQSVPAAELRVGDIVTVQRPEGLGLVTHRLVSTTALDGGTYEYVLRGDANETEDPLPYTVTTAGKYLFQAPYVGSLATAIRTVPGLLIVLAIALCLIAIFLLDESLWASSPVTVIDGTPPITVRSRT